MHFFCSITVLKQTHGCASLAVFATVCVSLAVFATTSCAFLQRCLATSQGKKARWRCFDNANTASSVLTARGVLFVCLLAWRCSPLAVFCSFACLAVFPAGGVLVAQSKRNPQYPPEFGQQSTIGRFAISETYPLAHVKMAHTHKQPPSSTIQLCRRLCSSTCLRDEARQQACGVVRSRTGSDWHACGEGFAPPAPGPPCEVASEATVQKPSSTASRRSEDTLLCHTVQKTNVERFFSSI